MLKLNEKIKRKLNDIDFNIIKNLSMWIFTSISVLLVIEAMQRGSLIKSLIFMKDYFGMFLLNVGIVLSITSIAFLFKRTKSVFIFLNFLILLFSFIGATVIKFRGTPLTAADVYSINDGFTIVQKYFGPIEMLIAAILLILVITLIVVLFKKEKKQKNIKKRKNTLIFIIPAIIFTIGIYQYNNIKGNIKLYRWDLNITYGVNGYLVSFIDSAAELKATKPETYTKNRINEIENELNNIEIPTMSVDEKPNIIVVQLESFFDPYRLKGIEFSGDPISNVRSLKDNSISGLIRVPCFGGGTVRSEFEVLTGYSANNLAPGEIPNNTILKRKSLESMAYILSKQGYQTTAVHNYLGNFYNRDEVYSNLGFDNFVALEYMSDVKTKFNYPSDMSNLPVMKEIIEKEEPQFIFNVAVESHGGYSKNYKSDKFDVKGNLSDEENSEIQEYIDKLYEVDQYVKELVEYVNNSGEPTIIAMYGDHLPAFSAIYNEEIYPQNEKYDTEYFIWSNMGVEKNTKNIDAYQLSTYIFDEAGINGGIMPNFHRTYMEKENYEEYLNNLQFDQLHGENYLIGKNIYEKSNMVLGLNQVEIDKAYIDGDNLIVEGKNFTQASTVLVNGKAIQTAYETNEKLVAIGFKDNIKKVQVGQEGRYGKMLSKTEYIAITK